MRFGMRCLSSRPGGSQLPAVVLLVGQSMKCQRRHRRLFLETNAKTCSLYMSPHMMPTEQLEDMSTCERGLRGVTCHWTGRSRWQTWALGCLPRRTPCHEHHEQRLKRKKWKTAKYWKIRKIHGSMARRCRFLRFETLDMKMVYSDVWCQKDGRRWRVVVKFYGLSFLLDIKVIVSHAVILCHTMHFHHASVDFHHPRFVHVCPQNARFFSSSICRFASKLWGLSGLKLLVLPSRRATDEELGLVHTKAQIAGLKRAASVAAAMKQVIWLPAKGSVETWKTDLAFLCVFCRASSCFDSWKLIWLLKTLDVLMRRRFWYGFLPGKVFKGGSTSTTWQKARYIFCPQFVGRCQMFSRRSEFIVWRLKPKICIQNPRNQNSTSGPSGFRNSLWNVINECDQPLVISASFLKLWNPSPFVLKIDSVLLKSFAKDFQGPEYCLPVCLGRIATAGGPKCRHFSARHCSMPPAWTPCRAQQQHRILFGQQCCSGSALRHTKASRQQKIEFQEFRFIFPSQIFVELVTSFFFLSHDQFLDPQLTGIPWSSNASWFLIGTCITGKVPRRFFGKIRRCSLLACVLAQHWHFLSMLFFHLGALNTRCLDR